LAPTFQEILVMSLFINVLALGVPIFVMQVYDRVVFHAGLSTLTGLVIGVLCILGFDWVLRQSRARILQRVALRIDVSVGRSLFEKLLALPLAGLEGRPTGYWHALFRDVDVVRNTLSGSAALMLCDLPFAVLFLGLTFVIARPVAIVLILLVPVFVIVAWRSGSSIIRVSRDERASGVNRDGLIAELIAGRTTVKALSLDNAVRPLWEERHAECIERAVVRGSRADGYSNLGSTLTMTGTVAMTSVGALAIIHQEMTIGALIAANMLSGRLLGVLNQLVGNWRVYAGFSQAVKRIGELFALEDERPASVLRLPRPQGKITLENVSFAYPGGRSVVDAADLMISPGGVCGLIGRNGSGKSTLLKLMQGLYRPTAGRVLLDGADITQFTRAELSRWCGYVPQECVLLAGTVRDNIAHRVPEASDEGVLRAAMLAGVHGHVLDLPDGYATQVGEGGHRLSAGQRQGIAIARALVGDPPVLLLDEPTSSLDAQATLDLRGMLGDLAKLRTVVVITHSRQFLPICRTIVHLERGRVLYACPAEEALPRLLGAAFPAPEVSRSGRDAAA
jgi:ABC-type bacteriocin/lantibiotic exporter with double-glycine peptidase domain